MFVNNFQHFVIVLFKIVNIMKKTALLLVILLFNFSLIFAQPRSGSNLDLEGFKFEKRLKGPKHKNSKIVEVMVDENDYYLAVTYKGPKSMITLIVYELYSWNVKGLYSFKSRAELYNSYFKEDGSAFYVNSDIYKQKFTEIILATGEINILKCSETPNGCEFLESKLYVTEGNTIGNNYYFTMDENRKNDIKVYVNKDMIFANDYMEEKVEVVEEPKKEEVKVEDKVVEEVKLEEIEIYISETEIEQIKAGFDVTKPGIIILLQIDANKKFQDKVEGDLRYVLLSLVDLSKMSFGNKIVDNKVTLMLKN